MGYFENDKLQGGAFTIKDDGSFEQGIFENGTLVFGEQEMHNKRRYFGDFDPVSGLKQGYGIHFITTQKVFEGPWVKDDFSGEVTVYGGDDVIGTGFAIKS